MERGWKTGQRVEEDNCEEHCDTPTTSISHTEGVSVHSKKGQDGRLEKEEELEEFESRVAGWKLYASSS